MEGRSMHPTQEELRGFVDQKLTDPDRQKEIADHVESCEFCSELCDNYRQLTQPPEFSQQEPLPEKLQRLGDKLYDNALRSSVIDLRPLTAPGTTPSGSLLVADGSADGRSRVHNIATLCSENPELVLRVMRAPEEGGDYLQLLAEDPSLAAHVMVQVPELGKEFVTDANGRADVDLGRADNLEQLKWQIKMPEAVFSLEPLEYDPDKVEYAEEIVLETDRHDRVEIRFEGKTEGKQLAIKVVELDGRSDFGPVKIAITQENRSDILSAQAGVSIEFGPIDSDTTINIRLYQ